LVGGLIAKEVFMQSMSKHYGSIANMLADMWAACPVRPPGAAAGMENFTKTAA
jgi:citronellol/citronellal dehydrogenase